MINLVSECNNLMKDCGFPYAICGGYALELFLNKKLRSHSDVDLSIFYDDKTKVVEFLIDNGWNVYKRLNGSIIGNLRLITNPNDDELADVSCLWSIKPDCSIFTLEPSPNKANVYNYEIIGHEQIDFDFIEIIFNKKESDKFVFDLSSSQGKHITRELSKAILYNTDGIPYLSPEVKLFIITNPVYSESDYHGEKNRIDFNSTAPYLPNESREWLINALEMAYPDGHKRIEQLKNLSKED